MVVLSLWGQKKTDDVYQGWMLLQVNYEYGGKELINVFDFFKSFHINHRDSEIEANRDGAIL